MNFKTANRSTIFILALLINILVVERIWSQKNEIPNELKKALSTKILTKEDILILHNIGVLKEMAPDIFNDPNILFDLSTGDITDLRDIGIEDGLIASFKNKKGKSDDLGRIRAYIVKAALKGGDLIPISTNNYLNREYNVMFRKLMVKSEDISDDVKRKIKEAKAKTRIQATNGIDTVKVPLYPFNYGEPTVEETIAILKLYLGYSKDVSPDIKLTLQDSDGKINGKDFNIRHINTIKKLIPVSNIKDIFLINFKVKELLFKGLPRFHPFMKRISWPVIKERG
jgi:hypothetical protein